MVAAAAAGRPTWANAPQITLKLHHSFSAVSCVHDRFLAPWARKVEAQSGGRLRIDLFPSMQLGGQPARLFDQARDGFAEIVWTAPSKTPGRFPKIEAFELPFVPSPRALVSSKALEDYAAANLKDEFREVHPICFSCADRGVIHGRRPIETIDAMRGLRLNVQTRFAGEALRALGARATQMPSAELPVAITERVVDGCVDPWDMVMGLRLNDQLKSHTDFADSSLSTMTFVLVMNKAAYGRLPPDLKLVIDQNSGQVAASMAGAMWDLQAAAVANTVAQSGATITTLMPEAVRHWREATEPVVAAWTRELRQHDADGAKLLADVRRLLTKYADEPEPQPPPPPQPTAVTQVDPATAEAAPAARAKPAAASAPTPASPPPIAKPAPAATPPMILNIPL